MIETGSFPPAPQATSSVYLVRYGTVPEVARFPAAAALTLCRGDTVVVRTHRGLQLGCVLEQQHSRNHGAIESETQIERVATAEDLAAARELARSCEDAFHSWCTRILQWQLSLELIDLEWTLDRQKLILYVLCERGPDSTKLALQAAAAGLGIVEVQPVAAGGLVAPLAEGKSCGSGGGNCGCSH